MSKHSTAPWYASPALKAFLTFIRPWRFNIFINAILFVIANALLAVVPVVIGILTDVLAAQPIEQGRAWLLAWVLVALSTGHNLFWRGSELVFRAWVLPISFKYESFLFARIINRPYPYFIDKFTGKISSNLTTISQEYRTLLDNVLFNYISSVINIVAMVLIATSVNWQTGLIVVTTLIAMCLAGRPLLGKEMFYHKIETDREATKNGHIIDSIANFVSVKSFNKEGKETKTVERQQGTTLAVAQKGFLWSVFFWGSMSVFVRDLMWPAIILFNLWMFLGGQISLGQFTTIISAAVVFTTTIWEVVWNIASFGRQFAKIDEAHRYLFGTESVINDAGEAKAPVTPMFKHELAINDLTFAYPDKSDTAVLSDVSLTIRKGEKIGVVGRSGSGKSTLTKLLLDYYEVPLGTFTFDGTPVASRALADHISFVPQDTALFHRSIAENIAYAADEDTPHEKVVAAARKAEADEFIVKLPQQYDTLVGERGVKLSGGQRQRIAIARAMLNDAPILVLDEATSALDSESELLVQKALENLWQDKTVIAIAHRLSTLKHMDRIIVMDGGRIIEDGTHQQLIARGGTYAKLWAHQSGGFIEE
ncbi:ABC transporter ATP-binding protein [Candidatus Saccharibacteria bacterium]|nr:ABC transporter ATP-binding protein [Candidatus Saccharibacteria bacterium]